MNQNENKALLRRFTPGITNTGASLWARGSLGPKEKNGQGQLLAARGGVLLPRYLLLVSCAMETMFPTPPIHKVLRGLIAGVMKRVERLDWTNG